MTIDAIIARAPIIPVLTVETVEAAIPLARALVEGGLPVLEVTLRTKVALEVIAAMAQVPGAVVGAGTVLSPADLEASRKAGAVFGVSPGLTPELARAAEGYPFLPGAVTPSEIMAARDLGYGVLKFFPAEIYGGQSALAALAGPFGGMRFCPTGGVRESNLRTYLALPNVAVVGGTWLAGKSEMAAGDWAAITARARRAVAIARGEEEA
ncbi:MULTISPECIES: bifunctional 4-hydroxy-2-oxoglutarate aldolase/2-dehydro-3-deoxy-phosphogluconate aldolase [Inquilinus]|uniref:2-dehydro-3-deoxy-phosphogluconate aldolase n=1 Tax=Inquilinus ginsengisoli TaxID=363840 RepID=A0ABU1JTS4_9PROT|nr:bifunctional 4-hydroxy-2-oxoglutarate aldolase/2-dehydro-3-deoxy-phosphogluconate aldolase [Inquilinus ginsengisoli]MDR6292012.1 2-dehydro-3-deoxyphosphogluconate aldolase/(4S)-4-hydroxy-2-oxoglutarate aldolase [Inquilinus ginsengisoli]